MKDRNTIKRKILTDRNFPDSDQINRHRNFKSIKENYSLLKSNWLKKIFIGCGAIIGTAVVAVIVYTTGSAPVEQTTEAQQLVAVQQRAYIQQPLPGVDVPFSMHKISVKNGGTFRYKTGSSVAVPSNAFVREDGKSLSDSITIAYREFHDPHDIFVSGIPMRYDSAGTSYTFESAGMIEIRGYDGDKPLKLDNQKAIEISMVSANEQRDFNLYQLDTVNKNWVYLGKDEIITPVKNNVPETNKAVVVTVKEQKPVKNSEPMLKPELADPQKYCFNIGYDKKEFPELSAYDNVLFEVADNNFKPAFYKISWDKISLQSTESKGLFIVKLKKADTTISVKAKPVFDKDDYEKALKEFEAKQNRVQKEETLNEEQAGNKLNAVNKELSSYNRKEFIRAANFPVDRRFSIRVMGIYNCDRPIQIRVIETQQVATVLAEREKAKVKNAPVNSENVTIYMVEKGKNAVFTFNGLQAVNFNRNAQNLIWTVTGSKQIAFFNVSDFDNSSISAKPVVAVNQEVALAEIRNFSK